mmetsp:Transcript_27072/g.38746  ORF Transcript_27072/g.38746 Transcript_27072/m.38746 type:complete len:141 (-) Transcript_27072:125-547(-)|eukprot:CAMPEP_0201694590 /NCGR_PEP_ID=MMETSP0578-20130828/6797_1 /ASSEMBLY_ACC=CAM_ASM_000663 /TAXON_ID=267565 /ORGANISM="Skeletonema grethea, Strain CCMP 1804" /LENGTH=140 /DNA_ID=CAMNT_0048180285 /DNA_START=261 /DNA_END=686 /DNA_ORIENTATION=-
MAVQRKGKSDATSAGTDAPNDRKRIKRGRPPKIPGSLILTIVLSLILLGNCAYLGFHIGNYIADTYYIIENEHRKEVEEVKPKPIDIDYEAEYAALLNYPPPPKRRGIRRPLRLEEEDVVFSAQLNTTLKKITTKEISIN